MKRFVSTIVATVIATAPLPSLAQGQDQTLADIRQQLSILYVDVQRLQRELSTTGAATSGAGTGSPLDRLNAIEGQLQRLTSLTEELEFRINRIATDGTNRVGDLEFRLCELEPGCDIGSLGDTPTLGGVEGGTSGPAVTPSTTGGPELAVGERVDFERAQEALASGDFRGAADQFTAFITSYPGGPLSAEAYYRRGEALEGAGETAGAARSYLDSFSGDPASAIAPQALFKLGVALGTLGQTQDACITLGEVAVRFPGDAMVAQAQAQMQTYGCN